MARPLTGLFPKLACRLNCHTWKFELKGQQVSGSVYPIRFRSCLRCGKLQKEVFDEASQTANWLATTKNLLDKSQ